MKKRIFFAAILVLVAWLLLSGAALAQRYVFQDLGDLGGGGSVASGLNDTGQVVGSSYTADNVIQAYVWDPKTKAVLPLGDLGGFESEAYAINNLGQVAGSSFTPDFYLNPVLWDAATQTIQDLGNLSVAGTCELLALNDQGQAAGYIFDINGNQRAFTLDPPYTTKQLLPNLYHPPYVTAALGINNNGEVVGESQQDSIGNLVPFWYHPSTKKMDNLGTLTDWPTSAAFAINNHSQIVGGADIYYYENGHAFIWDPVNKMQDLDPSSLNGDSAAYAINDAGQVVGSFNLYGYPSSAFIWTAAGGMKDLNSLVVNLPAGTHLDIANGINKTGQIVGSYNFGSGAFLLTVAKPSILPALQLLLTD